MSSELFAALYIVRVVLYAPLGGHLTMAGQDRADSIKAVYVTYLLTEDPSSTVPRNRGQRQAILTKPASSPLPNTCT